MSNYKYKNARKIIKNQNKMKRSIAYFIENDDFICSLMGENVFLKTDMEGMLNRIDNNIRICYEILNNPIRYKNR